MTGFVYDTKVTMADGSLKNIGELVIGDLVLAYNSETKTFEAKAVEITYSSDDFEPSGIFKFSFDDGTELIGSDEARFLKQTYEYGTACVDDTVLTSNGTNVISNILYVKQSDETDKLYCISVADLHNFVANGKIVHNASTVYTYVRVYNASGTYVGQVTFSCSTTTSVVPTKIGTLTISATAAGVISFGGTKYGTTTSVSGSASVTDTSAQGLYRTITSSASAPAAGLPPTTDMRTRPFSTTVSIAPPAYLDVGSTSVAYINYRISDNIYGLYTYSYSSYGTATCGEGTVAAGTANLDIYKSRSLWWSSTLTGTKYYAGSLYYYAPTNSLSGLPSGYSCKLPGFETYLWISNSTSSSSYVDAPDVKFTLCTYSTSQTSVTASVTPSADGKSLCIPWHSTNIYLTLGFALTGSFIMNPRKVSNVREFIMHNNLGEHNRTDGKFFGSAGTAATGTSQADAIPVFLEACAGEAYQYQFTGDGSAKYKYFLVSPQHTKVFSIYAQTTSSLDTKMYIYTVSDAGTWTVLSGTWSLSQSNLQTLVTAGYSDDTSAMKLASSATYSPEGIAEYSLNSLQPGCNVKLIAGTTYGILFQPLSSSAVFTSGTTFTLTIIPRMVVTGTAYDSNSGSSIDFRCYCSLPGQLYSATSYSNTVVTAEIDESDDYVYANGVSVTYGPYGTTSGLRYWFVRYLANAYQGRSLKTNARTYTYPYTAASS